MITFILPGYSAKNKDWADDVAKNLKLEGQIRPIYWDHWENPEKHFRPKEKARLTAGLAKGQKVNIIAKSVGTLVAAYIVESIPLQINKVILCGIPTVSEERLGVFQNAYKDIDPGKIICYQNDGDPFEKPPDIKKFMDEVNPKIEIVSKPRSDHHYPYYEDFNHFLT